jgi:Mn2+/Fe2+ NRAMP family transporter
MTTLRGFRLTPWPAVAAKFYTVLAAAVLIGLALDYLKFNAVRMLFWSAVLNGCLAPPLIVLVVLLTSDRHVMGERTNSPLLKILGWFTASIMALAAVVMILGWML